VAGGCGITFHWIWLLVSISAISPQSICHSVPVCENLSKSGHTLQKKITSCRFSRWWISTILDFRGPIIGSLKSPCTTSYRSSIETVALNCLVFEKITFLYFGDRQTNKQMDRPVARSRCRERRLNNPKFTCLQTAALRVMQCVMCDRCLDQRECWYLRTRLCVTGTRVRDGHGEPVNQNIVG